jgi:hypothetical protein
MNLRPRDRRNLGSGGFPQISNFAPAIFGGSGRGASLERTDISAPGEDNGAGPDDRRADRQTSSLAAL